MRAAGRESLLRSVDPAAVSPSTTALPTLDNVSSLSREELAQTLRALGAERGEAPFADFERRLAASFERVGNNVGALSPADEEMLRQRFETAWRVAAQAETKKLIRDAEVQAQRANGVEDTWLHAWVTVGDAGVCTPCDARHGDEKTYQDWERIGLPGAATCEGQDQCRCSLIPIAPGDEFDAGPSRWTEREPAEE